MKKSLLLIFILIAITSTKTFAQGYTFGLPTMNEIRYYYVGSLAKQTATVVPHGKLRIEIFGGSVTSQYLGMQTFIISVRDGLRINKEIRYGDVSEVYTLSVYENNGQYDFVIKTAYGWTTLGVHSWCLNPPLNTLPPPSLWNPVEVKVYDPAGKTDVTSQFQTTITMATNNKGDIGIGTITPKAKLDVRGKIIADEVEIKVNKGADFVFKPDYKLKELSEVEEFIKNNKHLPEIPSEKQMQKDGLNVSEMQVKLLQKVEELTLYVIELKKENEAQSQRIEKQEALIESLQNKLNK